MLEQDVRILSVGFADVDGHQGDVLQDEVREAAEVGQGAGRGHFRADDDVRPHRFREVHREIVARTAVHQHHSLDAHGPEIAGNGHRGPHRVHEIARGPVLLVHAQHIRGDAEERDRELVESHGILVADGDGAEGVPDVVSEQETVRQAHPDLGHHLLAHIAGTGVALLVILVVAGLPVDPGPDVLIVIVERNRHGETLLVATDLVRLEAVRNLVGHHHGPVDGADQRVQVLRPETERVEARN